jgi:hypothetical protein
MRINESERETVIGVGREGDGAIEMQAKLDVIIKNGSWFWPHARSDELVEVQSKLFEVEIGATDLPIWNSKSDQYNCADTWELLREKWPVVGWWKLIWFPNAIPRHSFIMWLVFYDALVTKQKMSGWGYVGNTLCLFCYGCQESREHLFFRCSFSRWIWTSLMADCFFGNVPLDWDNIVAWCLKSLHGNSFRACMGKLILGATV